MEEKHNYHEPCSCNNSQSSPIPAPQKPCGVCRGSDGSCSCLPPKVVPVQADGCPILFRRVEIPASAGDETTDPPVAGKFRNVLLVYEATGSAFLYSSDGIPTQLPQKGDKGDKGEPGPAGPVGPAGPAGPQGEAGPQGIQGEQGPQGPKGEDGAGIEITGSVPTYADLPSGLTTEDDGKGYYVEADGKLYIWNGTSFPANGDGVQIQGPQGPQGIQGIQGEQGPQGVQGPAGANGVDGISPTATVTHTDTGATISITDVNGTTTANITNGTDGANGQNGSDGFSPIATVTQTSTGATISITDANGTTTADITNGTGADVPIATTSVAGKVKPDGTTITVSDDGTISSAAEYVLPAATDTTLGGIKVGNNLSIDEDGVLSATASASGTKVYYGTSSTSSLDNVKIVNTSSNDFVLETGVVLAVTFSNAQIASIIRLIVDGGESIQVMERSGVPQGKIWGNNEVVFFVYDGTYWKILKAEASTSARGVVLLSSSYTSNETDTVPTSNQLYQVYQIADGKQNALTAGSNITIENDTISAIVPTADNINSTDWNALWQ